MCTQTYARKTSGLYWNRLQYLWLCDTFGKKKQILLNCSKTMIHMSEQCTFVFSLFLCVHHTEILWPSSVCVFSRRDATVCVCACVCSASVLQRRRSVGGCCQALLAFLSNWAVGHSGHHHHPLSVWCPFCPVHHYSLYLHPQVQCLINKDSNICFKPNQPVEFYF